MRAWLLLFAVLSLILGSSYSLQADLLARRPVTERGAKAQALRYARRLRRLSNASPAMRQRAYVVMNALTAPEIIDLSAALKPAPAEFPPLQYTVFPVDKIPNWSAMRTAQQWNRLYFQLRDEDFIPVPAYEPERYTTPLAELQRNFTPANQALATAKLFYSTRYMGSYNLDAGEFTGKHAGLDLKLARGTPLMAIAGGRVNAAGEETGFGKRVIVEHRTETGEHYFSIYAHLDGITVFEGQDIAPGDVIGTVGMTGHTTGPHLHLQVDRADPGETGVHIPYVPKAVPTREEAAKHGVNPIEFIERFRNGER